MKILLVRLLTVYNNTVEFKPIVQEQQKGGHRFTYSGFKYRINSKLPGAGSGGYDMKGLKILLVVILLLSLSFAVWPADAAGSVRFLAKNIYLYVDGNAVNFPDQQPYVDSNERIMVPVRFPAQTLGAKVGYDFSDPENREVYIQREAGGKLPAVDIIVKIGDEKVKVNGKTKLMDTVAVAANGRTMVPVRFVSEYLGAEVRWHDASKAAHVFSQGQSKQEQDEIIIDTAKSLGIKKPVAPESPQKPVAPTMNSTAAQDKQ